jgi:sugar lactone lactonase YvrE
LVALVVAAILAATASAGAAAFPDRLDLPDGWQPEGIARGNGHELFVGSIPTGAVYRLDARTGDGSVAVPGREGHSAIGLKADRHERLFVAGGETGDAFVYDAATGDELARFELAPEGQPTFVNDVTLTRDKGFFTDSQRAVLYVVDRDLSDASELPLQDFQMEPGFNLNGIVDTRRHHTLLAVQINAGRLWRIDAKTGESDPVDLGGATLTGGDGLLLRGRKLYVVLNELNEIAVVRLDRGFDSGRVVRTITDDGFDVPTTIAGFGPWLYAANARFDTPPTPTTEYWVTRVRR